MAAILSSSRDATSSVPGRCSTSSISLAHSSLCTSGRSTPRAPVSTSGERVYLLLEKRATVYRAPADFAQQQESRFISSWGVTAASRSNFPIPSVARTSGSAPLPSMVITSWINANSSRARLDLSITTTSCPAAQSLAAKLLPAFPAPIITIRILRFLIRFVGSVSPEIQNETFGSVFTGSIHDQTVSLEHQLQTLDQTS